ncbi:hypothetical protein [Sphingomonas panni]|uniref:hypothetical protein n=1 Tax=Sphingomonas panni TaxID=237612 RepID=UPI001F5B7823|nr:hypothetical protein [Sphingomonas panni]
MYLNHDFAPATRRAPLPRIRDDRPMTPGGYIRLRRISTGLSQHDVAQRMAALCIHLNERKAGQRMPDLVADMLAELRRIEQPETVAERPETIARLAAVLPIDADVYWQLADYAPDLHPRVCRGCGTSAHDHDAPRWATRTSCERCDPAGDGL